MANSVPFLSLLVGAYNYVALLLIPYPSIVPMKNAI